LEALRKVVRSKFGQDGRRGLEGPLFKNLRGINPSIPGVEKTVLLVASDNAQVRKGAIRTVLYARDMFCDPRFTVLSLNEPQCGTDGKMITDKDIRFRSNRVPCRMEVKQIKLETQQSNLSKYKVQIDKMMAENMRTGEMQVWVNREPVLPALKAYAESKGVRVYDKVTTGDKTGQIEGNTPFKDVLNDLHKRTRVCAMARAVSGGIQVGFGLALVARAAPEAGYDLLSVLDPSTRNTSSILRLGEHGSFTLAGVSMTATGAAEVAQLLVSDAKTLARLRAISRAGGIATVVLLLTAEGFVIAEYVHGDLSRSQFWTIQADFGGGLAGGWAGGWAGARAGFCIGGALTSESGGWGAVPGAIIGGIAGAMGGGYAGSKSARWGVESYFQFQEAERERKYDDFIYRRYGVSS
jgi:hypothetical protein